ncbi:MAG: ATP-dependent Clp protease ATP-binding subunit [Candidatus Beckwithbacteria bacterium]|nr:ATP-dependent Clp protease ATP-binding subunit [Candidatus Beckwithbacteria bacterium]
MNRYKRLVKNLLIFLDNRLALSLMLQMLFVPLFHDVSFLGRVLSFIYRVVRIVIGSIVMSLSIIAIGFWLIIWLILSPIISTISWLINSVKKNIKIESSLIKDPTVKEILKRLEIAETTINNIAPEITFDARKIKPEQLLLTILKQENWRYKEAQETVKWLQKEKSWGRTPFIWDKDYEARPIGGIDRGLIGIPTPTLDKYSVDLTKLAQKRQLAEMFCKAEAVTQITEILSRREKNNVLVVGAPGSGKTTLVKSIAQEIVRGVKAKSLKFKRLISLDVSRLAAGAGSGELNQRMTKIIEEITTAGNIILFVDEVHNLASINQDSPETSKVFIALEPALSEGVFQFIGATTTANYKKALEPNEAFARLFELVELKEADNEQTLAVLEYLAWEREQKEKITVSFLALKKIIELAAKLIHDRVFPDKAVNLLDEVVAVAKNQEKTLVIVPDVEKLITQKTKVPVTQLTKEETALLLNLEKKLHQRVIGQDKAIKAVADAIRRARTGLKQDNKPIASFLFGGPTGVGKTETAKTLAAEFFGSEKVMIRLDMSEYQNLNSLDRLNNQLTGAVKHQPYTLILLDELEKAHSKILNLFLQVLDDARLTDSTGKTIDFSNTIIIATTNAGTKIEQIESAFPPEFLNRFSGIIVFETLSKKETEEVIKLKLKEVAAELAKQEIIVNFNEEAVKNLIADSFSTKWGGRQIDRTIQEKITNVIAEKILQGEIKKNQAFEFKV